MIKPDDLSSGDAADRTWETLVAAAEGDLVRLRLLLTADRCLGRAEC